MARSPSYTPPDPPTDKKRVHDDWCKSLLKSLPVSVGPKRLRASHLALALFSLLPPLLCLLLDQDNRLGSPSSPTNSARPVLARFTSVRTSNQKIRLARGESAWLLGVVSIVDRPIFFGVSLQPYWVQSARSARRKGNHGKVPQVLKGLNTFTFPPEFKKPSNSPAKSSWAFRVAVRLFPATSGLTLRHSGGRFLQCRVSESLRAK
ncbi:hypothetical protein F5148DRAFT_1150501 [Russula earlei]|uniref:Uncharacterized protein n=1 Tax=Russula earlei TaxID=71964 RepID=A0ACC0U3U6_9AGAM|nr:hypothetical protein F5148DRAFT_1150501 [Russula earlei]